MIGENILHYKIIEKLGEGGMGEVFKAQDTKLDRFVALKFLPSQITSTSEVKERFIQEAKAASAMNHPNVCTIHDIQGHNDQLFIVMEYIDGFTLRDNKQVLSEKRILEIAAQVADGLGAAHEKGIVHRDIKPENIMIRKDGIAQIMDFGLAKLYSDKNVSRLTKAGTTMGTMGFMSPEQVQGLDVDHRTDIFSLGVVLYELLAGESPFKGMHETAIMYEIVNVDPPPIATVKEGINPELDQLILECLEKDKDERFQSAKELARSLRKLKRGSTGSRSSRMYNVNTKAFKTQTGEQPVSKSSGSITIEAFNKKLVLGNLFSSAYLLWSLIGILFLAVIYLTLFKNNSERNPQTSITSIVGPENIKIIGNVSQISHDGKSLVYGGVDSLGNFNLWLRKLNSKAARKLEGTNGAEYPFWSYDDKFLFFFDSGKLKKIDISSGAEVDICNAVNGRGGDINKNGQIVFAPNSTGGLYIVSANGGTPKEIVKSDSLKTEESLRFPFFLPDGEHFLYTIQAKFSGSTSGDVVKVGSINSDIDKTIMNVSSNAAYADGYLFFVRQSTLMCQAFDPDSFELSGDIITISGNISYYDPRLFGSFSVSNSGNLIYQNKSAEDTRLILTDSKGNIQKSLFTVRIENNALFSPDGTKILYDALGSDDKNADIWVYNIGRNLSTRLTFNANYDANPIWSPDGKYIAFSSDRGHTLDIFIKSVNGTGSDSLIYRSNFTKRPTDWSSDGRYIAFTSLNPKTKADLGIIDLKNNNATTILNTPFNEFFASFSDNMKWIMYTSDESGRNEVYIRPFKSNEGKWQVSTNGGFGLKWINNDKDIIYGWQNNVYKVSVDGSGENFVVGKPELLFSTTDKNITRLYDVARDGKTFLGDISSGNNNDIPLTFVHNWKGVISDKDNI